MVKMAFETMLKYERQQEEQRRRANKKEHFIYLLTQVENADPALLREMARDLGYPEEMVRAPILLKTRPGEASELLNILRSGPLHTNRDFSFAKTGGILGQYGEKLTPHRHHPQGRQDLQRPRGHHYEITLASPSGGSGAKRR